MPSMQERLWRAMRIKRCFPLGQLALVTETTRDTAGKYVHALRRAGFLRQRGDQFVLVRDSGPQPPKILFRVEQGTRQRIGVYDRNTDTGYGLDGRAPPTLVRPQPVRRPLPRRPRRKAGDR